jgi:hypothetical protein
MAQGSPGSALSDAASVSLGRALPLRSLGQKVQLRATIRALFRAKVDSIEGRPAFSGSSLNLVFGKEGISVAAKGPP